MLVGALALGAAPRAEADLIFAATVGGVNVCATDNNSPCLFGLQLMDQNPLAGTLSLLTVNVGGLLLEGSLHTQFTASGAPGSQNILNSSSLSLVNATIAPISFQATLGATDFVGPVNEAFTTGSGTWVNSAGSSINLTWYNDALNRQSGENATDREGLLVDTFADVAGLGIDSFSHNGGPFAVVDPPLFSMALGFEGTMLAGSSLISRGQSEVKPVADVAEPGTVLLLGAGLAGLARRLRRRTVVTA
jgi:hypothetical protein